MAVRKTRPRQLLCVVRHAGAPGAQSPPGCGSAPSCSSAAGELLPERTPPPLLLSGHLWGAQHLPRVLQKPVHPWAEEGGEAQGGRSGAAQPRVRGLSAGLSQQAPTSSRGQGSPAFLLQWRCNTRLVTSSGVHRGHRAKLGQILTLPCGKSNIKPQPCCLWKVSMSIPFKGGVFPSPLSWSPFWYRLPLIRERLSREVPGQGWTVPDRFGCGDTPIPSLDCPTP